VVIIKVKNQMKFVVGLQPSGLGLKPNYELDLIFYFNDDHLLNNLYNQKSSRSFLEVAEWQMQW